MKHTKNCAKCGEPFQAERDRIAKCPKCRVKRK